jgi:colanic acid/amylovoran biosynthesis glycosyltransferase
VRRLPRSGTESSMNLMYVTSSLPGGSAETYIVPEIEELQKRGHRITVIPVRPRAAFHADARRLASSSITTRLLSVSVIVAAAREFLRSPNRVVRAASMVVTSRNARVLVKNFLVFPKGLWLAGVARGLAVDHIHAHWASTSATVALIAATVADIPWSFTAHRWDISENNLLRQKARTAKFVRVIGERAAADLSKLIRGHQEKLRVIHMGVPLSDRPSSSPDRVIPLRVLLGARFVEVKGHRFALDAVRNLKSGGVEVSLECAGDGPLRRRVERYARELDVIDCVHFVGLMDHQDLLVQLRGHRWDAAILPSIETSKQWEGIPVVLMEAMAARVPVVATKTGGIPELLEGGAGVLVPERDSDAIAEALTSLAVDPHRRHRLAEAGFERVRDRFTIETTVSSLLAEIARSVKLA